MNSGIFQRILLASALIISSICIFYFNERIKKDKKYDSEKSIELERHKSNIIIKQEKKVRPTKIVTKIVKKTVTKIVPRPTQATTKQETKTESVEENSSNTPPLKVLFFGHVETNFHDVIELVTTHPDIFHFHELFEILEKGQKSDSSQTNQILENYFYKCQIPTSDDYNSKTESKCQTDNICHREKNGRFLTNNYCKSKILNPHASCPRIEGRLLDMSRNQCKNHTCCFCSLLLKNL